MAIDQTTFIRRVRTKTGAPAASATGGDGLDDTAILDCVAEALLKMSQHLDRQVKEYVTSSVGVQGYSVTGAPAVIRHVFEEASQVVTADDFLLDSGSVLSVADADSVTTNPADYEIYIQNNQHIRRLVINSWHYNPVTTTLTIEPAPSTSGYRIYFISGYTQTLATCPAHYEGVLMKYVEAEVLEALAAKRVRVAGISSTGFPTYGEPRLLLELAEKKRTEAHEAAMVQAVLERGRY